MAYARLVEEPLVSYAVPIAQRTPNRLFLSAVAIAVGVSSIVLVEPAPVDALVLGLAITGFLSGILSLRGLRSSAVIPLAVFLLANLVSLYDPINTRRADFYAFVTFYLSLSWGFFVALPWAYGARVLRVIIQAYVVAAMVCIVPGLLSYFHVIGLQQYLLLYGRPKGTFKDPNVYGPYLIPVAMFAIAGLVFSRKTKFTASLQVLIAAISSLGVFLSYSRASWINYAVSLLAYFFFSFTFRPVGTKAPFPLSRIILVVVGIGLSVGIVMQLPDVRDMYSHRVTSSGLQGYDKDRFRTQRMAVQSAIDRPLGIGPGQAEYAFLYSTHSSYMRVLCENGFVGLVSFVAFILICLARGLMMGWKTRDEYWQKIFFVASACILGHIVNSGVVDTIHWRHFWLLLALPWCHPGAVSGQLAKAEVSTYEDAAKYRVGRLANSW